MKDEIGGVLFFLWMLVGGVTLFPLRHAWAHKIGLEALGMHFILFVIWLLITIFAIFVSNAWTAHQEKKKAKQRAIYESLYVTQSTLHDARFGNILYRWDNQKGAIVDAKAELPPFDGHAIFLCVESINGLEESAAAARIPAALAAVYDKQQEIPTGLCAEVKQTYDNEGVRDAAGNPIDEAYIAGHLSVDGLRLYLGADTVYADVWGSMDTDFGEHIAEHGVTAHLDCTTGACEYYSG